ncbi:MAG: integrase [Candidatus Bathyarchaeia archaeon]
MDANEVFDWIKKVKTELPQLSDFMDLMAISGMRLVEAVESYNLIIKIAKQNKLDEYYNVVTNALENYKFKDLFIRRTKKSFVVFVPKELFEKISCSEPLTGANAILKLLQKRGIECRFGDVRETHATLMTKYLNQNEIDFLHGRVGTSVFMQNYFNPALINDLKQRVFKGIAEVQSKIS